MSAPVNPDVGLAALLKAGRVRKIVCSFPRQADSQVFDALYRAGRIELELVPQGNLAERIRAAGAGIGGFFTPTGYGTELAKGKETRVIDGKGYVLEAPIHGDLALIKAERGDRWGNLTYRKAARNFGPVMAMAARKTVATVHEIVPLGELDPETVVTPGIFVGNIVRIALLAAGVAAGPAQLGFDVMAEPWHGLVGLLSLGLSAFFLLIWANAVHPTALAGAAPVRPAVRIYGIRSAVMFCVIAIAVVAAPHRPIDVGARTVSISAPPRIGDYSAVATPLTPAEQRYFEQYGGAAVKARYGPYALLLTRTTAPLRHLHAPDECLRGLGYRVEYVGLRFTPSPSARYRADAPDGRSYEIDTRFISSKGQVAASVSEAVWIWLRDRSTVWTAVQRLAPAGSDAQAQAVFDAGVIAALDLPSTRMTIAQKE